MMSANIGPLPPRFVELKEEIASSYPNFQERVPTAWADLLRELKTATDDIAAQQTEVCELIPAGAIPVLTLHGYR